MSEGSRQEYVAAWQEWFSTLPAAEQERLRAEKIDAPLDPDSGGGGGFDSITDFSAHTDFDFGAIDGADPESTTGMLSRAICAIFDACLKQRADPIARLRSVPCGFVALLWMISWRGLRQHSLRDLAPRLGFTAAALSFHVTRLSRQFGLVAGGMKSVAARQSYARSAAGNRNRLGTGKANGAPAESPANVDCHSDSDPP